MLTSFRRTDTRGLGKRSIAHADPDLLNHTHKISAFIANDSRNHRSGRKAYARVSFDSPNRVTGRAYFPNTREISSSPSPRGALGPDGGERRKKCAPLVASSPVHFSCISYRRHLFARRAPTTALEIHLSRSPFNKLTTPSAMRGERQITASSGGQHHQKKKHSQRIATRSRHSTRKELAVKRRERGLCAGFHIICSKIMIPSFLPLPCLSPCACGSNLRETPRTPLCPAVFFFSFIRSTIASFDVGWRQALSRGATVLAAKEFFERNY